MISMKVLHRADAAASTHYYAEQKDDYYSRDGQSSVWQGAGAAALGLVGAVDPARFKAMLAGSFSPRITLATTIRRDAKARAGVDMTFSAPKSVTLQALVAADGRVVTAHDAAVETALAYVERELAMGRYKIEGESYAEQTGNLIIAKFRHETARPTAYARPDPQLHTHAIIMNLTQRKDGAWVSLSNEEIMRLQRLIDAHYLAALAAGLEHLGYELRFEGNHFELAHYTRPMVEAFSKRLLDINRALHQMGLDRRTASREQKALATLRTRHAKEPEMDRAQLQADWQEQARAFGIDLEGWKSLAKEDAQTSATPEAEPVATAGGSGPGAGPDRAIGDNPQTTTATDPASTAPEPATNQPPSEGLPTPTGSGRTDTIPEPKRPTPNFVAIQAIRWAVKHLSEREAVMSESDLLASALRHASGRADLASLQQELRATVARGTLLIGAQTFSPAEDLVSRPLTRAAWAQTVMLTGHSFKEASRVVTEEIIAGRLLAAEPQYTTVIAHDRETEILAHEATGRDTVESVMGEEAILAVLAGESLLPGQRAAASLILGTRNRIVGVQGLAGTGKSHMLNRTRRILEQRGYKMIAMASYSSQVRALQALGVAASTIASRLEATNKGRFADHINEKTVLVVDEAGVVPSRLMIRLIKLAEHTGARLVLLGDTGQTPAIEAGKPFAQMQRAGMATAVMGDIIRQKNPTLKAAVQLAATGRAKASLSRIEEVVEIKDEGKRYLALANRYAEMSAAERAETLIVTGTNTSRNAINEACHIERGLAGQGRDYTLLTRRDATQAERRYAKYYAVGDIIQPERNYACGLVRGEMYRVTGAADNHRLRVCHVTTGEVIDVLPSKTQKLSVYEPVQAELSVGDWVRVTRNDAERDLANGERFEVASVSTSGITLAAGGRTVSLSANEPLHIDRAYATTAHSAQGLTCDRVLINAESFSRTTKQDVYYVGISRARREAIIYTNDQKKLPAAVARCEEKSAALELVSQEQREYQHGTHRQRTQPTMQAVTPAAGMELGQ